MGSVADADLLEQIAIADLDALGAINVVRHLLATEDRVGEPLYRAFRSWTWQALTQRRREPEMRGWHDLMRKTAAALRSRDQAAAADRLLVLAELVFESVQSGEHDGMGDVLQRAHVRRLLTSLLAGYGERARLGERLGLKSTNLTRVLNMVVAAGLVERRQLGKHALFTLTLQGRQKATALAEAERGEVRKPGVRKAEWATKRKIKTRTPKRGRRTNPDHGTNSRMSPWVRSIPAAPLPSPQQIAAYTPGGSTVVNGRSRAVADIGLEASPPITMKLPRLALERSGV